jgi:TolA-binding protein
VTNWIPLITLLSGVAGVVIAWLSFAHAGRKDSVEEGHNRGTIASDIGYIKAGVDDLKRENQEHRKAVSDLSQRVTRCEESCRQAHRRIDELRDDEQQKQT